MKKAVYILSAFVFASVATVTYSATAGDNVVISEVQIAGSSASDEFVELYNPTNSDIDLTGWKLTRFSSTGAESNLDSSLEGSIPALGYYLLGHANYDGEVLIDEQYSTQNNISSNGAVRLYSDDGVTEVDTVGFGTGLVFEAQSVGNPSANGSVSRNAGLDTDNNFDDFIQNEVSDPQNSASTSASPSPTPTETPTPSASPTEIPSESPTSSPSSSATATPTLEPSPSPTPTLTPTEEPTSSPTATPTPTSTNAPVKTVFLANLERRICRLEYRYVRFGFLRVAFPRIVCN